MLSTEILRVVEAYQMTPPIINRYDAAVDALCGTAASSRRLLKAAISGRKPRGAASPAARAWKLTCTGRPERDYGWPRAWSCWVLAAWERRRCVRGDPGAR